MKDFQNIPVFYKFVFVVLFLLAIGASVTSVVLYKKTKNIENPQATTESQIQKIVKEVGGVLVLPTNETPTLATVSDPSKLADQPFFAHAMTGDIVLVYTASKKAILWRPSTKQVVEVSSVNTDTSNASVPQAGVK